jgi:hypothetical protein
VAIWIMDYFAFLWEHAISGTAEQKPFDLSTKNFADVIKPVRSSIK